MQDRLNIAIKYKKTIEYILIITDNYPHKYFELKSRIINNCFDTLELIYYVNVDKSKINMINPKIEMLDYYMKLSYKYNIISKKKYLSIGNYLIEIIKMINGWKNEKSG